MLILMSVICVVSASGRRGSALVSFKVNHGPSLGECSVKDSGVEMDTLFKVYCREWWDQVILYTLYLVGLQMGCYHEFIVFELDHLNNL